jgi:hypothetical protein
MGQRHQTWFLLNFRIFISMEKKKLTTEEFIKRAKLKHGDRYDYSKTEYFGKFKKLLITCSIHGDFNQEAWGHIKGKGCIDCSGFKPLTTAIFIERANLIHDNLFNYDKSVFLSRRKKIIIGCQKHGDFEMTADHHLTGRGCPKCAGFKKTIEEYIIEAKKIHGNLYDYSESKLTKGKTIQIKCQKHGVVVVNKYNHINKGGPHGCPVCSEPKGERIIKQWLIDNNINYVKQKTFKECKNIQALQFDFYIPTYNICIEYDGVQHYKIIDFFGGKKVFLYTRKLDKIKNNYCLLHNIPLHRIRYDENILNKLNEIFGNVK